jgi:uncharacterized membrane protein YfcA
MEEQVIWVLMVVVGFIAGFINTIAGGASVLTLPAMILIGLDPTIANGTNRLGIAISAFSASAGYQSKKINTFPFSIYLGLSATIGSVIGAMIAVDFDKGMFNRVLAVIMIIIVLLMILKPKMDVTNIAEQLSGKRLWISIAAFFVFGIYGGFINAGMGLIMMIWLNYFNKMDLIRTNATKVLVAGIYTVAAIVVFLVNDLIDWKIGLLLALGNMVGGWISARLSVKKGEGFVKAGMMVMVIIMAIKLWFF